MARRADPRWHTSVLWPAAPDQGCEYPNANNILLEYHGKNGIKLIRLIIYNGNHLIIQFIYNVVSRLFISYVGKSSIQGADGLA